MLKISDLQQVTKAKIYNNDFTIDTEYDSELDCKYRIFDVQNVSSETNYNNIDFDFHHRWLEMNNFVYTEITGESYTDWFTAAFLFDSRDNADFIKQQITIWAIKILLPPHTIKLELLDNNENIIASYTYFKKDGDFIEYANSYQFWFVFRINMTLPDTDDKALEEYLHKINHKAHIWDVASMPPELIDKGSMAKTDYILNKYTKEADKINVSTNINNNLLTNDFRLFYLGERVPFCKDMQQNVPQWRIINS